MTGKKKIRYATKSPFKRQEVLEFLKLMLPATDKLPTVRVGDAFEFEFYDVKTEEPLERNLATMVDHKARSAYRRIMAPCVAEHAGLFLKKYDDDDYPGGLTQPMWDALGPEEFLKSVKWAGAGVIARSFIGYCDGRRVTTFVGERLGKLAASPRGTRKFYWDSVFCPDGGSGKTYAEIASARGGLAKKMALSQSTTAFMSLFNFLRTESNELFSDN